MAMTPVCTREIGTVNVGTLMSQPVRTVKADTSIEELTELMTVYDYNGFPVVDEAGILHGLVTRLDLFKLYLAPYVRAAHTPAATVDAIMTRGVVALHPDDRALKAIALMVNYRLQTIPIVMDAPSGQKVVGIVTRRDLAGALKP